MGRDSMAFLSGAFLVVLVVLIAIALHAGPVQQAGGIKAQLATKLAGNAALYPNRSITPGATNPSITQATIGETICNKNWSTKSERDKTTSAAQKSGQYAAYHIAKPDNNSGQTQSCELDHLISLELGGADSLGNIWPECGPSGVALNQRYFKEKDAVENYLHAQVCADRMTLSAAQHAIVNDWYMVFVGMHKSAAGTLGGVVSFDTSDPDDN